MVTIKTVSRPSRNDQNICVFCELENLRLLVVLFGKAPCIKLLFLFLLTQALFCSMYLRHQLSLLSINSDSRDGQLMIIILRIWNLETKKMNIEPKWQQGHVRF